MRQLNTDYVVKLLQVWMKLFKEGVLLSCLIGEKGENMVDSKTKKATVSAAKKNITASGVRIENGIFVDDEGSIVDRIAEKLPKGTTIFDIKISIEISDEESESAE